MFSMETLSFQMSQPIRSSKDILVSIDTIKHSLGKRGERYSFKKKSESKQESTTSSEASVDEVMEAVMACEDEYLTQEPVHSTTDEDGWIKLFYKVSRFMFPMLD